MDDTNADRYSQYFNFRETGTFIHSMKGHETNYCSIKTTD